MLATTPQQVTMAGLGVGGPVASGLTAWIRGDCRVSRLLVFVPALVLQLSTGRSMADSVELLSGTRVDGEVVARDNSHITLRTAVGGRFIVRRYPISRVHAVTVDGKREVLNPKAGTGAARKTDASSPAAGQRTPAEVEAVIERLGRTPPDWWDSTPLEFPKTLDLSWPQPPPGGWNNQRNVGQYVWDIINPNPRNWRQGVRFMHHLLSVHGSNPSTRLRVMRELGRMYHGLLQDYARAAFWWRHAGVERGDRTQAGVHLAECYWKLGSRQMAVELLRKLPPTFPMIKLWADLGETQYALRMAEANTRGDWADLAYLYAGDASRVAGRYQEALSYYQKLLAMPAAGRAAERIRRSQQRARANLEAIKLYDTLDLRRVPDGTYRSSSLGYEAPVHVEVTVSGGRIGSVRVTGHREKQFYSAMTDTPKKIIEKQGFSGIDATSGATITSEAIINATAKALATAMK